MSWLHRLLVRWFDRHDPAIYQTGVIQKYAGYDYAKAKAASQRSKSRSESGRKFLGKPSGAKSKVVSIKRKVGA